MGLKTIRTPYPLIADRCRVIKVSEQDLDLVNQSINSYKRDIMGKYLLHGKLSAKDGRREELAQILIEASKLVSNAQGCNLYVISLDNDDANSVFVTEIWDNKVDHDNSLKAEGVKELIMQAMPIINGLPTKGQELEII